MSENPAIALLDGPPINENGPANPAERHAQAVAGAIRAGCREARITFLPVFTSGLSTSVSRVVDALRQAAESDARIVHCSFGLPRFDALLADAVKALLEQERTVVASAPARGGPVWPAAFPDVFAVQGDARCAPNQWSWLDLPNALLGAHPHSLTDPGISGSSIAAAHLTGLYAALPDIERNLANLQEKAAYSGRERRTR
ncbi:MAG: hypothetical protein R3C97_11920 [Geminicoccaceae bacterium]